jgi:hypothetical protein
LTQLVDLFKTLATSAAPVERFHLSLRFCHTGAKGRLGGLGMT